MFAVGSLAISVNTPAAVECRATTLSWSAGVPPYSLTITDQGGAPHTSDLILGVAGTSYTWVADFPAGTAAFLTVEDNAGNTGNSAGFLIGASGDSSCF